MKRTAAICLACLLVCAALSLLAGPVSLRDPELGHAVFSLRAVRTLLAALAGACLAVGGVLMQGLFRNPLADPGVIGAESGAILGGQIAFIAAEVAESHLPAWLLPELVLPFGSVLGALAALLALLAIARRNRSALMVLLAGFLIGTFCVGLSGLLSIVALRFTEDIERGLLAFSLGGVEGKGWHQLGLAAPLAIFGIIGAWHLGRALDVLLSGEEESSALGVPLRDLRRWAVVWCALLTAAATVAAGAVAFVGLLAPHVLRGQIGATHRRLIPLSAIAGAAVVIGADVLARILPTPSPLPISAITGLVGAPIFFWLLLRSVRVTA